MSKTAAVAMSGGLDSSVTAMLLRQQGFEVVGVTGKMVESPCADIICENAKKVADKLGIGFSVIDLTQEFNTSVVEYFKNSYKNGYTPNPCIECNKHIKWGKLFEYAIETLGADFFATGHYANIKNDKGIYKLYPAKDVNKDQLYFLYKLGQKELSKTIFPLSNFEKSEIRELAQKFNLPSKDSKESQDICFIQKPMTTKKYLISEIGEQIGNFIEISTGKVLGHHNGFYQYTIGQRKGIGIAHEFPLYVVDIDAEKNIVYLGKKDYGMRSQLVLKDLFFSYEQNKTEFDALVKIRYNMPHKKAHINIFSDDYVEITFDEGISAITPGQAGVIYDLNDGHLIGGGTICW